MSSTTAWLVAGALWLGCLAGGQVWLALVGLGLGLVAATIAVAGAARSALGLTLLAVALTGGGLAGGRALLMQRAVLAGVAGDPAARSFSGRVVTEPRDTVAGAWAIVRVTEFAGWRVAERALLRLDDTDVEIGLALAGRARASALPDGPFGGHVASLGAVATLTPVGELDVSPAPRWLRLSTWLRERSRRAFEAAHDHDRAAILSGLVLGTREGVPRERLADAGLVHLVVVSGRHVGVLLAGVLLVAAGAGLGIRGRRRLALAALWWFVVLTRWQPSVLRAAVMASLVLVAGLRGRPAEPAHSLAMTVLALLLVDPQLAGMLGFALSVLATAGVLVIAPRLARLLPGPRPARLVASATIGAQLGVAPVLLTVEGTLPSAAVPANLVAAPAAAVAQTVGLIAALVAVASVPVASRLAAVAGPAIDVMLWAADRFTRLPRLGARSLVITLAVAGLLWVSRSMRVRAAVLAAASLLALLPLRPSPAGEFLELTVLDVGQGDGLLIEAPGGRGARMLVDAGPDERVVADLLRARRIRALNVVVLTHGDHDHSGGLAEVLRRCRVGLLLVPVGLAGAPDGMADSAAAALAAARTRDVPVAEVHAGLRFALAEAEVEVLAPAPDLAADTPRNGRSVVPRVSGRYGRMLLTGDVEERAESRLLRRPDLLRADVLKVPHHGGASNAPGFLEAVRARVAVISVGADNTYGHPAQATLASLRAIPTWRTDQHGTVSIALTGDGPRVTADNYTPVDERSSAHVPAHGPRGAVAASRCGAIAGGAAQRDRRGAHRSARQRGPRAGSAGPAHGIAVRRSSSRAHPGRPGAARRVKRPAPRRAGRLATRRDGDPAGDGNLAPAAPRPAHQGAGRPGRCLPAQGLGGS